MNLLPGVNAQQDHDVFIVQSQRPLLTLASAVIGGGLTRTRTILNRHVSKQYDHPDPAADMLAFARERGIAEPFVGLMTAAYLEYASVAREQEGALAVAAVATVGLSQPTAAGLTPPATLRAGTINIILLIDAKLTPAALVNAVITVTETKVAVMHQARIRTASGEAATGTATDAIVVACTDRGATLPYAGPVTPVGWLIGRAVRRAVGQGVAAWQKRQSAKS